MKKILGVLLASASVAVSASCSCSVFTTISYLDSNKYTQYEQVYNDNTNITALDLNWINGSVEIVQGDAIRIEEQQISDNYFPLYYYNTGSKLFVQFAKSGTVLHPEANYDKKVVVTIPSSVSKIDLNCLNNGYRVSTNIENLEISISNVDGRGTVESEAKLKTLEINTVSGAVDVNVPDCENFGLNSVSGDLTLKIKNAGANGHYGIETVSSNADVYLDGAVGGYKVNFEGISKEFHTEFDGGLTYGNESVEFDVSCISCILSFKRIIG